jgi:hypothetical protein
VEVVERLLFYRVDGQCTRFSVNLADEYAAKILSATTNTGLAIGYATVMWTELALNFPILQALIIPTLFHL